MIIISTAYAVNLQIKRRISWLNQAKQKVLKPLKNFPMEEYINSGHRACQGCAEVLAVRHVLKAIGPDMVLAMATGAWKSFLRRIP